MAVRSRSARVLGALLASGTSAFGLVSMMGSAGASPTLPRAALTGTQHRACAAPLPGTAACHAILLTPDTASGKVSPARRPATTTTAPTTTAPTTTAPTTTAPTTTAPTTTIAPTTTTVAPTTTTVAPTTTTVAPTTTTVAPTTTAAPTTSVAPAACAFPATAPVPSGYGPCDLQSAYGLLTASATASSTTPTVAIVDAYDDPTAASDLAHYRSEYGLPACGTGCFTKVNQTGGSSFPRNDTGWAQEISLDLDMVSATCPSCHIVLVEANTSSFSDLLTAENEAASFHPAAISNSWGAAEFNGETLYDSYFDHPGTAITVSTGDTGYGVEYPAASPNVTAVGGTSLTQSSTTRGWSETVWAKAGSGCSAYEPQPSWQTSLGLTGCSHRMTGDVAAVADPNTGVAVYDTDGYAGWLIFGGTSVASPIIASVYALAGNTSSITAGSYPYSHAGSLNDVTSGSNSTSGCSPAYLCTGEVGYDGPTGLGTPAGTGGF